MPIYREFFALSPLYAKIHKYNRLLRLVTQIYGPGQLELEEVVFLFEFGNFKLLGFDGFHQIPLAQGPGVEQILHILHAVVKVHFRLHPRLLEAFVNFLGIQRGSLFAGTEDLVGYPVDGLGDKRLGL
jgi:hypothetical protein